MGGCDRIISQAGRGVTPTWLGGGFPTGWNIYLETAGNSRSGLWVSVKLKDVTAVLENLNLTTQEPFPVKG